MSNLFTGDLIDPEFKFFSGEEQPAPNPDTENTDYPTEGEISEIMSALNIQEA